MIKLKILTDDNDDSSETGDDTEASVKSSEHFPNDEGEPEGEDDTTVEPDDDEDQQQEEDESIEE